VANITLQAYLKDLEGGAKRAVLMTSQEPDVIDGLAEFLKTGNRQKIENALLRVAKHSDLNFLAVTDAAGKVVARSDRPLEFGGDYSVFASVRAATGGKEGAGYEPGDGVPMALRHGAPVARDGKIIGAVSGGYDLSLSKFVDKMKDYLCAEVTAFTGDERVATTVTDGRGKRNIGTKANEAISKKVLAGEDYIGAAVVAGKDFYTYYAPIRDAAGKGLGMTFVGMDVTATKRQIAVSIAVMVAIVAVFRDRKSTRLNSSHTEVSRMPSSA
jgi:methyl-accepting chemotaxis protein